MKLSHEQAHTLAHAEFDRHGLRGWSFTIDHARQRCGSCNYRRREITVSKHLLRHNGSEEFLATLRHEIAHALVGPRHAHDRVWRQAAARIGAPTEVTNSRASMPEPRWLLICSSCEQIVARRHRRALDLRSVRCAQCGIQHGLLRWHDADRRDYT